MRNVVSLLAVLVIGAGFLAWAGTNRTARGGASQNQSGSSRPELEYLKAVNSAAPPQDPQLLFLSWARTPTPTSRRKAPSSSPHG